MKVELAEYLWTPQRTGPRARSADEQIYSFRKRKTIHRERHTLYKKSFIRSKETFANTELSPLADINVSSEQNTSNEIRNEEENSHKVFLDSSKHLGHFKSYSRGRCMERAHLS